ncbi:DUF6331 family protein [Allorhizobium sp. NPDC080224]|jgi:hypothetical protein|uniref:DUF6331 family protein n=1 Tax=Allorhizobium sp. NPDC080224 TaxID=3390547 RepID=UPI003D00B71F
MMIEITLPASIGALCKTCETTCEKECCGIRAFNFSPFNIIYHLTKVEERIRDSDVAEIRTKIADISKQVGNLDRHADKAVIAELNAILTVDQAISLFDLIDSALSDGCTIYSIHEKQIEQNEQQFSCIIGRP